MSKKEKYIEKMFISGHETCESLYMHGAGDISKLFEALINGFSVTSVFECHGDGTVSVTLTNENPEFRQEFTGTTAEVIESMYDWVNSAFEYHGVDEMLEYGGGKSDCEISYH